MGAGMRIRRVWKAGLLLAVGAAGGGAALAVASVPDSNGVIHACVQVTTTTGGVLVPDQRRVAPDVTVIDPGAGQHCITPDGTNTVQTALSWNAIGRRGPAGPPGKSVTVAGGHTLTLAGGGVVTVGSSKGLTVTTPTLTPRSKAIGIVDLGGGLKFPLYSYDVAKGKSGGGTGAGGGRVAIHDLNITKYVDKSSPLILRYCVSGTHIPRVVIHLLKPASKGSKPQEYLKIKLTQVFVSSYQQANGGTKPSESISLNYTKIEYKNVKQ